MKYKITVIKYDKNENYEAEMAKWKESLSARNIYTSRYDEPRLEEPQLNIAERSLEVFLTEEEYNAVKKSVLATFE